MDSYDDETSLDNTYRATGKGRINTPLDVRASRSMEHRAPVDAQLRLFPAYEPTTEDDSSEHDSLTIENENRDEEEASDLSPVDEEHCHDVENTNSMKSVHQNFSRQLHYLQDDAASFLKYANNAGNELLKVMERRKVAEDAHKVMLAL